MPELRSVPEHLRWFNMGCPSQQLLEIAGTRYRALTLSGSKSFGSLGQATVELDRILNWQVLFLSRVKLFEPAQLRTLFSGICTSVNYDLSQTRRVTTLQISDATFLLRWHILKGSFQGKSDTVLRDMIQAGGFPHSYTLDPEIGNIHLNLDVDGKYLEEALTTFCATLGARWNVNHVTGDIEVFSPGGNTQSRSPITLPSGTRCLLSAGVSPKYQFGQKMPEASRVLIGGKNVDIFWDYGVRSQTVVNTFDFPESSQKKDYPLHARTTEVIKVQIVERVPALIPDFSLSIDPLSVTVHDATGMEAVFTVTVTPVNGFTGTVGFDTNLSPDDYSVAFVPATVTTSGDTTLTITPILSWAIAGSPVDVMVTGTSGSLVHTVDGLVVITPCPSCDFGYADNLQTFYDSGAVNIFCFNCVTPEELAGVTVTYEIILITEECGPSPYGTIMYSGTRELVLDTPTDDPECAPTYLYSTGWHLSNAGDIISFTYDGCDYSFELPAVSCISF